MEMEQRIICALRDAPLTTWRSTESLGAWAQREYVACYERGVPFSAHGDVWLYGYGTPWAGELRPREYQA